jgi:hypothetical protein
MSKQATVQGLAEMRANIAKLSADIGPHLTKAAVQGARLVQSRVIKSIKTRSQGEEVERQHPGQAPYDHTASRPGDAPNTDTGELIRGIQVEITPSAVFVGVEASQDAKAMGLEFGTMDGRLAARPFLFPAFEASKSEIVELLKQAIKDDINATGRDVGESVRKAVKIIGL